MKPEIDAVAKWKGTLDMLAVRTMGYPLTDPREIRVAESRDRDSGGTGIGLAITARVVFLYKGQVSAHNASTGGLRVEIRLPLRRD